MIKITTSDHDQKKLKRRPITYGTPKSSDASKSIEFKDSRATHSAKFDQKTGRPENRVKQGEVVISQGRNKFQSEREETKRVREENIEPREPAKKVPRRFKFSLASKQIRKMFQLMGSGKYDVNLETVEDEDEERRRRAEDEEDDAD